MLKSENLTKKYGSLTALDSVSLSIESGHVYAMLGPNGSGKTTWMKSVIGLVKPTSGQILYKGEPIGIASRKEIAYMSTEPYFYNWMTIKSVGKYYQDFFADFSMEKYEQLLARMELAPEMKTKTLSTGMMAKLKIAVTMARAAKVIMLDEPLNGIDLIARDEIGRTIVEAAEKDVALIVSSHLVEELETLADTAVFMKHGKLVDVYDIEGLHSSQGVTIVDKYREVYGHEGGER